MAALAEYSNVYNSALLILREKGFQLWYEKDSELYFAERDGWDFASDSPCGLLGLVAMYEAIQPQDCREYWWRKDGPEVYGTLPDKPPRPYRPVYERKPGQDT